MIGRPKIVPRMANAVRSVSRSRTDSDMAGDQSNATLLARKRRRKAPGSDLIHTKAHVRHGMSLIGNHVFCSLLLRLLGRAPNGTVPMRYTLHTKRSLLRHYTTLVCGSCRPGRHREEVCPTSLPCVPHTGFRRIIPDAVVDPHSVGENDQLCFKAFPRLANYVE
ncbi:hypothetical protein HBI24_120190 [Parastagonospora nodorum]|nr:hypothetical protein HBI24_120190 [Parastagonospora nodorum]